MSIKSWSKAGKDLLKEYLNRDKYRMPRYEPVRLPELNPQDTLTIFDELPLPREYKVKFESWDAPERAPTPKVSLADFIKKDTK